MSWIELSFFGHLLRKTDFHSLLLIQFIRESWHDFELISNFLCIIEKIYESIDRIYKTFLVNALQEVYENCIDLKKF